MKPIKLANPIKLTRRPSEGEELNYKGWTLHYTIGDVVTVPVKVGDHVDLDGGTFEVQGGEPPHKPSSTGRVHGLHREEGNTREYYPSVIGCKWVENAA